MFATGKAIQPSEMFEGKAIAYLNEAPFRRSTIGQAPGHVRKHYTSLERLARDRQSSLLLKLVNYGRKK